MEPNWNTLLGGESEAVLPVPGLAEQPGGVCGRRPGLVRDQRGVLPGRRRPPEAEADAGKSWLALNGRNC